MPGSALQASHAGGSHHRGWNTDRYLLKAIFDVTQMQTYYLIRFNAGKKARRLKVPKAWPGPDEAYKAAEAARPKMTVADLARSLSNPFRKG